VISLKLLQRWELKEKETSVFELKVFGAIKYSDLLNIWNYTVFGAVEYLDL
jgi:hypothetical protein